MSLTEFGHWNGTTKSDIQGSVIDFKARRGVFPDLGSFEGTLTFPVLNASGGVVTINKGDIIWPSVFVRNVAGWSVPLSHIPFQGIVTNVKQEGDFLKIEAESLLAPLTRMSYVLDNSKSTATAVIMDILSKYTPPLGTSTGTAFVAYRNATGPTTWPHDATTAFLNHGMKADVRAVFQYLTEQPVHLWLQRPTCALYPTYDIDGGTGLPQLKIGYTGYKNYRPLDIVMSYDTGILSDIIWEDPTESVINDVTIRVRGDASVQMTDAASIAAYGQRQTTLLRSVFVAGAVGANYDARNSCKAILESMKSPQKRCRLTCDITALIPFNMDYGGLVGLVYQIVDGVAGVTEDVCLRTMTYIYPQNVCECEFDNAPLNISDSRLRDENRLANIEDNAVMNGGGPNFTSMTLNNTVNGTLVALADGSLQLNNTHGNFNFGPKNANYSYLVTSLPAFAMNKPLVLYNSNVHDIGSTAFSVRSLYIGTSILMGNSTFVDSSRNVTAGHVKPHSINTLDLGDSTNRWRVAYISDGQFSSLRSLFNDTMAEPAVQLAQAGGKNIWMRMRQSGGGERSGLMFSVYDSHHFYFCGEGTEVRVKYTDGITGMNYAAATEIFKFGNTGIFSALGGVWMQNGSVHCKMSGETGGRLKVETTNGHVIIGPNNTTWCHFYTDRSKYYFDKGVDWAGNCDPYTSNSTDLGQSARTWRSLYLGTGLFVASTQVLDASRNLSNIGTVGCGAITSTGAFSNGSNAVGCGPITSTGLIRGTDFVNGYPVASATVQASMDATHSTNSTTYVTARTFVSSIHLPGAGANSSIRFYFEIAGATGNGATAEWRLNGTLIGTAQSQQASFSARTQDLKVDIRPGDVLTVMLMINSNANNASIRNCRIQYTPTNTTGPWAVTGL